jgi:excinuclease UvrABC nuclease subunit
LNFYPHHIGDTWKSFDPLKPALIPANAGVYVLFLDGVPVYVGQSNNLRARIYFHKFRYGYAKDIITPWGAFSDDCKFVIKCKVSRRLGDWAMWEIRLIHKLKPKFNTTYAKIKRAA